MICLLFRAVLPLRAFLNLLQWCPKSAKEGLCSEVFYIAVVVCWCVPYDNRYRIACLLPSLTTERYYFVLILRVTTTDRQILLWHWPWAVRRCSRSGEGQVFENQTEWKRVETRGVLSDVAIIKSGRGGFIISPYVISSLWPRTSN